MKPYPRLVLGAALLLPAFGGAPEPPGRMTQVIDGIRFEFAPGQEPVVRELAPLVAALNREAAPAEAAAPEPLSVADLGAHRGDYLRRIAAAIGLAEPTAAQQECYGAFLENFRATQALQEVMLTFVRGLKVGSVTVWTKDALMDRLRAGQAVTGFSLDADGQHVNFDWHINTTMTATPEQQERLAALDRERARLLRQYTYHYSVKNGEAQVSGEVRPQRLAPPEPAHDRPPPPASPPELPALPAVIKPDQMGLPPKELAAALAKTLGAFRNAFTAERLAEDPYQLAYLIFHETTEVGVVDRYIGSADRRWLCEGIANYTAWRIARDVAGDAAARRVYDLEDQLARYAGLRQKINLRKWPAVENQRPADAETPLTRAHYAYATRAVSMMVGRHGAEVVPKLLQAVGATPRPKVTMRTVARAYRQLTGEDLFAILDAAVGPL